jgi:hypothetical protein
MKTMMMIHSFYIISDVFASFFYSSTIGALFSSVFYYSTTKASSGLLSLFDMLLYYSLSSLASRLPRFPLSGETDFDSLLANF